VRSCGLHLRDVDWKGSDVYDPLQTPSYPLYFLMRSCASACEFRHLARGSNSEYLKKYRVIVDGVEELRDLLEVMDDIDAIPENYIDHTLAREVVQLCQESDSNWVFDRLLRKENGYFMRFILPWLPGKGLTAHMIGVASTFTQSYYPKISNIVYSLLDSDISGYENEISDLIKKWILSGDDVLVENGLTLSKRFISDELGGFLISNYDTSNSSFAGSVIFNSTLESAEQRLLDMSKFDNTFVLDNPVVESLIRRFPESDLSHLFSIVLGSSNLLADPMFSWGDMNGSVFNIMMKNGTDRHVSLLEKFPTEVKKEKGLLIENLRIVLLSRKESKIGVKSVPLESFDNWINFAIKDDSRGFSESRLRGFYMGIREGPQPPNQRHEILNNILQNSLSEVHNSRVNDFHPQSVSRWQIGHRKTGYLLGDWKYSDFRRRISSAEKFIRQKPHSPWGYYAYEILNQDRWEILRKVGLSVGLIPFLKCSDVGIGLVSCEVFDINLKRSFLNRKPICCDPFIPTLSKSKVLCKTCGRTISDFSQSWEDGKNALNCGEDYSAKPLNWSISKSPKGKIVIKTDAKNSEFTERSYSNQRKTLRDYMPYLPKPAWDHLAAMHADIEEMAGISGDPIKRWGLD